MESKELIQDTVENVMENVNPSLIDKVLGNQKVTDFVCNFGIAGGCLAGGYAIVKAVKYVAPKVVDGAKNLFGKFGKKTPVADPIQNLTDVVDQATEA